MIIVCIGDSLTEGDYGIKGVRGVANVQSDNYPYFLSLMSGAEVRNYGKCGIRASGFLKLYDEGKVDVKGADAIFVMLGTNGGQSASEDTYDNRCYEELIVKLMKDAPQAKLVLIVPPQGTVNPEYSNCGYMPQIIEAQKFTRMMAEKYSLALLDAGKDKHFSPENEYVMQPEDGLHLGFMGYARLADMVNGAVKPLRKSPLSTVKMLPDAGKTKLVAHRGLSGLECENTAAAFIAAGNRAYYGIETDIWRTNDGKFICSHDGRTHRLCDTDINIEESSFDEVRALRLKDTDGKTVRGYYGYPTPEEYVDICKKYSKHCVPELKSDFTEDEIRQIIDIFASRDYLDNTTFIAFNPENLELVKKVRPEQNCQLLVGWGAMPENWLDDILPYLEEHKFGIDADYFVINPDTAARLHAHGIEINVWTVDNPALAKKLIESGVDMITTNILEY